MNLAPISSPIKEHGQEKKQTAENQVKTHFRQQTLVRRHAVQSNACTKPISKDIHPTFHNHFRLVSVYEIQVTSEINMCKQGERPHPNDKELSRELIDKL